jgi:outer membrane murein-binding lipoprotein Lpp
MKHSTLAAFVIFIAGCTSAQKPTVATAKLPFRVPAAAEENAPDAPEIRCVEGGDFLSADKQLFGNGFDVQDKFDYSVKSVGPKQFKYSLNIRQPLHGTWPIISVDLDLTAKNATLEAEVKDVASETQIAKMQITKSFPAMAGKFIELKAERAGAGYQHPRSGDPSAIEVKFTDGSPSAYPEWDKNEAMLSGKHGKTQLLNYGIWCEFVK